ncbi:hypothetical protein D3C87_1818910 [compost metagenome]
MLGVFKRSFAISLIRWMAAAISSLASSGMSLRHVRLKMLRADKGDLMSCAACLASLDRSLELSAASEV